MFDSFVRYKAEKNRLTFIKNCGIFDTPRLENEVYPAECRTEMDIEYKHGNNPLKLDIYTPFNCYGAKECFILIHGGAFVYGFKRLDQNFGMHLAIKANIPVVNIDYTLMPDSDLSQIINEIFAAINFVCGRYGFKKIHTVGDSAGGFLAYIVAMATRSRHIRHGLWVFEKPRAIAESAGMICPGIENNPKEFPGYYFEKKPEGKSEQSRLPDYAYDLKLLAERDRDLRVCVIAGEDDFLLGQNLEFKELVPNAVFYEGKNDGELKCHHVFPIAHPEWPQSVKAIALLAENAVGRR
jgi:hypothetical protein